MLPRQNTTDIYLFVIVLEAGSQRSGKIIVECPLRDLQGATFFLCPPLKEKALFSTSPYKGINPIIGGPLS